MRLRSAALHWRDDAIVWSDCGSANGSWRGQQRLTDEHELHDGDVVRVGDCTIELVLEPHRRATVIREAPPREQEPQAPVSREELGSGPTRVAPAPAFAQKRAPEFTGD